MPLPLLFIAVAGTTAIMGIGKGIKAGFDIKKANSVNKSANGVIEEAKERLNFSRMVSKASLEKLGMKKIEILDKSINRFVSVFGQLHNVELKDSIGLKELNKFRIDRQAFVQLKDMGEYATSILSGIAGGAIGGGMMAFGAWSAAGTFAAASTGTLISSLSGAAATNATLAFFGGGSLAAGGMGIAGGTMVLGGLVAGPALAIMGFIIGAKATTEKNKAYSNLAVAREEGVRMDIASEMCKAIRDRSKMFINQLERLDIRFLPLINQMEEAISEHGTDFSLFNEKQKNVVAAAVSMAGAIKAVLDTPILTEEGELTKESETIIKDIDKRLKN